MSIPSTSIQERLTRIFQRVFHEPTLVIRADLTAADVDSWDSLSHINLIVAIEKEFACRFTTGEIMSLTNVGALESLIRQKLSS